MLASMGDSRHRIGHPTGQIPGPPAVVSQFHSPPSQFDGCFTTFYHVTLEAGADGVVCDHLLPEWSNLRFFSGSFPEAEIGATSVTNARFVATGPSSRPCRFVLGTSRMWGVGLLPLGWARLIAADAFELANTISDGATHPAFARFDGLSKILCDPQIDPDTQLTVLTEQLERLMRPHRDEARIVKVHTQLVTGEHTQVSELASRCAMSVRTLERICRRHFGFTPKLLMRRQRFMRSLSSFMLNEATRGTGRWTEAMDGDYHDQAQFTREFREFMTMLPSEYAALDHPILASFMEARARIWGSAAQTLDSPDDDHGSPPRRLNN